MKMRSLLALAASFAAAAPALAGPIFVGSWTVDQGPDWYGATAYSGTDAAALLFGGSSADYVISTIDDQASDIDHLAWVSSWGGVACSGSYPCGFKVDENFVQSTGGLYGDYGDTSAYVYDWAVGGQFRNYAFRLDGAVPEPASWALMLGGFGLVGGAMRRRKTSVAFA